MKIAERVVMVVLLFLIAGGAYGIYYGVEKERQEVRDAVARGDYERPIETEEEEEVALEEWRTVYPNTIPITIGGVPVEASVADTMTKRIKGLSDTPFLPDFVVKLFVFGVPGEHSIWMKDMNYPLDILWLAEDGTIVHIEEDVSPDDFPESYASPEPAWFVVEANAGFVASNTIAIGDAVILPVN